MFHYYLLGGDTVRRRLSYTLGFACHAFVVSCFNVLSYIDVTAKFRLRKESSSDVTHDYDDVNGGNPRQSSRDVIARTRRMLWIDDVYVTGVLVAALNGRVRHTDMSPSYCKADKMAAVYRSPTEWYKYIFTQMHVAV